MNMHYDDVNCSWKRFNGTYVIYHLLLYYDVILCNGVIYHYVFFSVIAGFFYICKLRFNKVLEAKIWCP